MLNELKWEDFFVNFIKGTLLQLTAEDCAIQLSVFKLCLRDQSINLSFPIRLVDKSCPPFSIFKAADNLKATMATHSFLGLNENVTKLKIGDKSLF